MHKIRELHDNAVLNNKYGCRRVNGVRLHDHRARVKIKNVCISKKRLNIIFYNLQLFGELLLTNPIVFI